MTTENIIDLIILKVVGFPIYLLKMIKYKAVRYLFVIPAVVIMIAIFAVVSVPILLFIVFSLIYEIGIES